MEETAMNETTFDSLENQRSAIIRATVIDIAERAVRKLSSDPDVRSRLKRELLINLGQLPSSAPADLQMPGAATDDELVTRPERRELARKPRAQKAARGQSTSTRKPVPVKFLGPKGETWSGRGKTPVWVTAYTDAGGKLEELQDRAAAAAAAASQSDLFHGEADAAKADVPEAEAAAPVAAAA